PRGLDERLQTSESSAPAQLALRTFLDHAADDDEIGARDSGGPGLRRCADAAADEQRAFLRRDAAGADDLHRYGTLGTTAGVEIDRLHPDQRGGCRMRGGELRLVPGQRP